MASEVTRLLDGQTTASKEVLFAMGSNAPSKLVVLPRVGLADIYAQQFETLLAEVRRSFKRPPLTITLKKLHVSGWELQRPLHLSVVRREEDRWIICDGVFDIYGVGKEPDEAVRDYEATLIRFYKDTVEWEGKLAPHLQIHRANLQKYLRRKES